jgi:hypothetical protein
MRLIIAALLIMSASLALGQEKTPEQIELEARAQEAAKKAASDTTTPMGWSHKLVFGLDLSQVSYTDWAQGGKQFPVVCIEIARPIHRINLNSRSG